MGKKHSADTIQSQTITAIPVKNLNDTIVGSWLLWVAGAAAKLLPIIQFMSFTAALVLSCLGIYKFFKNGKK